MYLDDIKKEFLFGEHHLESSKSPKFSLLLKSLTENKRLILCSEMEYLQWLVILFLLFGQRKICKQIMIHKSCQIAAKDSGRKFVLLL